LSASIDELTEVEGVGRQTALMIKLIDELRSRPEKPKRADRTVYDSEEKIGKLLVKKYKGKKTEESHVIYLAFDHCFRIAYAVEYRVGQTFARAVEKLASLGDTAALVTYDPLTNSTLLKQEPFQKLPAVELLRPDYVEPVRDARSGGVIATGRSLDLLYPYAACHRMRRVYRLFHLVSWLTIAAATALSLLTVLVGRADILSSAAVTVWQILLTVFTAIMSLTALSRESLFIPRAPKSTVHGRLKDTPEQASETIDTNKDKE
jgi:hypothetical protein